MCNNKNTPILNIAFYPWFALGHLTSFLRLANKLAQRGQKISYLLPTNTQKKLSSQNHFPDNLTFIPIDVPPVDGLPPGAETTNAVSITSSPLIMTAMDMTRDTIESHLTLLSPDIVFYDFAYWMPELGRKLGFKSVHYITGYIARYAVFAAYLKVDNRCNTEAVNEAAGAIVSSPIYKMRAYEAKVMAGIGDIPYGVKGLSLMTMLEISFKECDAIGVKTCNEMERDYCEFVKKSFGKPVLLAGPIVPTLPSSKLDEHLDRWLDGFGADSVIYCALGSECVLELNQFQELLFGLELTGKPFLAALKLPRGCETIESALPIGFVDKIKGRGIIHGGWVHQQQILRHLSVGCFITHCGVGSLSEAMISKCQVVLMPQDVDQYTNARQMSLELKIGVEVEANDDGLFTKEAVHTAISIVMEEDSEVGREVKANHAKWREFISTKGLEDSYISSFVQSLQQLLG